MSWEPRAAIAPRLKGLRVLVVDDEAIIALDIESALVEAGATVIGPTSDPAEALAFVSREPLSVAVLDVRLGEGSIVPVAEALSKRGVPFIFYSGQVQSRVPQWPNATFLSKPTPSHVLIETILQAHDAASPV